MEACLRVRLFFLVGFGQGFGFCPLCQGIFLSLCRWFLTPLLVVFLSLFVRDFQFLCWCFLTPLLVVFFTHLLVVFNPSAYGTSPIAPLKLRDRGGQIQRRTNTEEDKYRGQNTENKIQRTKTQKRALGLVCRFWGIWGGAVSVFRRGRVRCALRFA